MEKIEQKMDQMMEIILERFNDVDDQIAQVRKDALSTKLELLDKLATKDVVADHELRLQKFEFPSR